MLALPNIRQWFVNAQPYAIVLLAAGAFLVYRGEMRFTEYATTEGLLSLTGLGLFVFGAGGVAMENGFLNID